MSYRRVFLLGCNSDISPKRRRSRLNPTGSRRCNTLTGYQKVALVQFPMQNLCSFESIRDVGADVPRADMLLKFRLMHQAGGLLPCAAQNETSPGLVHSVGQIFEGLQSRGVDRRHISQTKHDDGRKLRKTINNLVNLVRGSKKKRAVNPEDTYIRRDFFMLQDMDVSLAQIFLGYL